MDEEDAEDDTETDPGKILIVPETPSPCFVIVIGIGIFPSTDLKMKLPLSSVLTMDESDGYTLIPFMDDNLPFLESMPEMLATATTPWLPAARDGILVVGVAFVDVDSFQLVVDVGCSHLVVLASFLVVDQLGVFQLVVELGLFQLVVELGCFHRVVELGFQIVVEDGSFDVTVVLLFGFNSAIQKVTRK